ncbi:MAG: hypothetical protein FJ284_02480 [Planctomycetes bacterium]|nr:hypothetical protein [Planctomycetota bacterium]
MTSPRQRAPWLVVAALVVATSGAVRADEPDAARQAAERDAKVLGWLLQQGRRVIAPPVQAEVRNDQTEQIAQQAKQMERFFQPMLHSELELVRLCCDGLDPGDRKRLLAIGYKAVVTAARGFAERQLTARLGRDPYDPREEIRKRLAAAVAELASREEATAYAAAVERRAARRSEATRVAIVARLDRQLDLTAAQRRAIEADLATTWQPAWIWEIEGRGQMRINDYPIAPDQAAAAIEPHLDAEQAAEWQRWCRAAGSRMAPPHFNWSFDGQGLQQVDGWWTQ